MDEMGIELFADRRKEVMVYVRPEQVRRHGPLYIGIPRTSRRCTLIACISLSCETLKATIITRTKTVNSIVFEKGFSLQNFDLFTTENSFITGEVFSKWLREVYVPHAEAKRALLRSKLGPFSDKAVLIVDGCATHKIDGLQDFLAEKRIHVRFLVPNTPHLTQALDIGVFGRCRSVMMSDQKYIINRHELDERIVEGLE